MTKSLILAIQYKNGAIKSIQSSDATDYYTLRDVTGRSSRIGGKTAKKLIGDLDEACNEGRATLVHIDDAIVSHIRSRF